MADERCTTCSMSKPLTAFNERASAPDGRQARCRDCCRSWYVLNGERHRAAVIVRDQRVRLEHRQRLLACERLRRVLDPAPQTARSAARR